MRLSVAINWEKYGRIVTLVGNRKRAMKNVSLPKEIGRVSKYNYTLLHYSDLHTLNFHRAVTPLPAWTIVCLHNVV